MCSVEDCDKKVKTNGLCSTHYARFRTTGVLGGPIRPHGQPGRVCSHGDCEVGTRLTLGLCRTHYSRFLRQGDTELRVRVYEKGEVNGKWSGDSPTYQCAHKRLHSERGKASNYTCVSCEEKPAVHWAYNHLDENELTELTWHGYYLTYSVSPDFYDPMCAKCHKNFDVKMRKQ